MRLRLMTVAGLALATAGCGGGGDVGKGGGEADRGSAQGDGAGNGAAPANAAAPAEAPQTASNGRQFVDLAGAGDLFEIESARLAEGKATRPEVRELARMLLADHRRSTAQLRRAAGQAQPPLAAAPALSAEQQASVQALRAAAGEAFDREYLRQQVRAHERALTLVAAYASTGEVEPLRRHAAAVAEPIQRHLARARELEVPAPQ